MDPLGSTVLCRGSEVCEMRCIWLRGSTHAVFSHNLTCARGLKVQHSFKLYKCTHNDMRDCLLDARQHRILLKNPLLTRESLC